MTGYGGLEFRREAGGGNSGVGSMEKVFKSCAGQISKGIGKPSEPWACLYLVVEKERRNLNKDKGFISCCP